MNNETDLGIWFKTSFSLLLSRSFRSTCWSFQNSEGFTYTRTIQLRDDGRVGGYVHPNEKFWRIDQEQLLFLNESGCRTISFTECYIRSDGFLRLIGHSIGGPGDSSMLVLEQVAPPKNISTNTEGLKFDISLRDRKRRNLIIVCANQNSLHYSWDQNISNEDRNWDLAVLFYGDPQYYPPQGPLEYSSLNQGMRKYLGLHAAMFENSPLWNYERIMFMDDDIRTTWWDLNYFLEICRDLDLWLAQPALTSSSFITHAITEQQTGSFVRFTTFVECMIPCFARDALRTCIPTLENSVYGFGIDHIWPKLLRVPLNRIGIVDAVGVEHTRPLGATYRVEDAVAEEAALLNQYGMGGQHITETGRLSR